MKRILVLGAGRSSHALISYLLDYGRSRAWTVVVGDLSLSAAQARIGRASNGVAQVIDLQDEPAVTQAIASSDVVVSMLPASFHVQIARLCLAASRHLFTASYVSDEMKALDGAAREAHLLFLNECGLDPGIDHMSAMRMLATIRAEKGEVTSFESFTGGLISPETAPDNPWRYKFTWNPKNVVTAGQAGARYLYQGLPVELGYDTVFKRITPITVPGYGTYEGYANRDSIKYIEKYNLHGVDTLIRGTLRCEGFCPAWDTLATLGCCDDVKILTDLTGVSPRQFLMRYLPASGQGTLEEQLSALIPAEKRDHVMHCLAWSGFFGDRAMAFTNSTAADVVQSILDQKWQLHPDDRDMIVMWHRAGYVQAGKKQTMETSLVVTGKNAVETAMANTVGLPLAIGVKLLLEDKIAVRGVVIPTLPEIYDPILKELATLGISFEERVSLHV